VPVVFTAKRVVTLTVALVFVYIVWKGPERFYYESFGTLLLSPVICTHFLPLPYNYWLTSGLVRFPVLGYALCLVPVFILILAAAAAIYSFRKNSLPFALLSLGLTTAIFSVYHYVQPMGISVVYFR